ncbi:MAG: hypothetical protein NUW01_17375 [Gemmatimonadaceae bacterium]|nr:hypothetical protein [Gemmatimonadaceae bacterium]
MQKLMILAGMLALAACQSDEAPESRTDLTKRQADSAIGASGLPGAQGITRAMNAADSAAARNARLDSAASEP